MGSTKALQNLYNSEKIFILNLEHKQNSGSSSLKIPSKVENLIFVFTIPLEIIFLESIINVHKDMYRFIYCNIFTNEVHQQGNK